MSPSTLKLRAARSTFSIPHCIVVGATCCLLPTAICYADGPIVDKIYHPYVDALEQEIEFRTIFQDKQPDQPNDVFLYQLAYGRSFGDKWFGEIYLIAEKSDQQNLSIEAYEVEAKWQLTEQGEFWADWGLLFELEKEEGQDIWEFATAILTEKEWRRWSGTANLYFIQEWGGDIDDKVETSLGLQARYRYSRLIEPAIEFYSGEDTNALGPVLMGNIITGNRRALHWETGVIFGLDRESPNQTLRFLVEYEF